MSPARPSAVIVAALTASAAACAYNPLFPDPRGPAERAHELDARCSRPPETLDAEALSAAAIEGVEPAYAYVQSGNDRAARLRGARLHIRPQPNFSAETLHRSLECHEARVVTGRAGALADDPYILPGSWLDIDAQSTGDGFVVAVVIDDVDKARQVLARARRFASSR
jgi:hypothetical protein